MENKYGMAKLASLLSLSIGLIASLTIQQPVLAESKNSCKQPPAKQCSAKQGPTKQSPARQAPAKQAHAPARQANCSDAGSDADSNDGLKPGEHRIMLIGMPLNAIQPNRPASLPECNNPSGQDAQKDASNTTGSESAGTSPYSGGAGHSSPGSSSRAAAGGGGGRSNAAAPRTGSPSGPRLGAGGAGGGGGSAGGGGGGSGGGGGKGGSSGGEHSDDDEKKKTADKTKTRVNRPANQQTQPNADGSGTKEYGHTPQNNLILPGKVQNRLNTAPKTEAQNKAK